MKKEKRLLLLQNALIYFFICSFIGWILEVIYAYIVLNKFVNRGFLFGPICPIYGYGALIMIITAETIKKKKIHAILLKFILITVLFSALEYIASFLLEILFGLRWWDYTTEFMNLNGRICLMFSLTFGILGILFIQCIYEPTKKLIQKIRRKVPDKIIWTVSGMFLVLMNIDMVLSIIKYLK